MNIEEIKTDLWMIGRLEELEEKMEKRTVEWWEHSNESGVWEKKPRARAVLLHFGVNSAGIYLTAILELPNGTVKNVPVENIRFVEEG